MNPKFPPRHIIDIALYDADETVVGYRECVLDAPMPGDNRSPSYRWGWANRLKDRTGQEDGFEYLRQEYIRWVNRNPIRDLPLSEIEGLADQLDLVEECFELWGMVAANELAERLLVIPSVGQPDTMH